MQMWQHAPADTVSSQADRSTIKHAAAQAVAKTFRQAEPRAVLGGALSSPRQCRLSGRSLSVRRGFDTMTSGNSSASVSGVSLSGAGDVMYISRVSEQSWQKESWKRQW